MRRAIASLERTVGTRPLGLVLPVRTLAQHAPIGRGGGRVSLPIPMLTTTICPYWTRVDGHPHLVIPYTLDNNDMKFSVAPGLTSATRSSQYLKDAVDVFVPRGKTHRR